MNNIILKNGFFGGLIVSAVMIYVTYAMKTNLNMQPSYILGFGSMIIAFSFIIFGILQQRKANNEIISFLKALKTGVFIAFVISTIYVLVWLIIFYNFFPDFVEKYGEIMKRVTPAEELVARQEELEFYKKVYQSPVGIIGMTYVEIFLLGIIFALISALILKKK